MRMVSWFIFALCATVCLAHPHKKNNAPTVPDLMARLANARVSINEDQDVPFGRVSGHKHHKIAHQFEEEEAGNCVIVPAKAKARVAPSTQDMLAFIVSTAYNNKNTLVNRFKRASYHSMTTTRSGSGLTAIDTAITTLADVLKGAMNSEDAVMNLHDAIKAIPETVNKWLEKAPETEEPRKRGLRGVRDAITSVRSALIATLVCRFTQATTTVKCALSPNFEWKNEIAGPALTKFFQGTEALLVQQVQAEAGRGVVATKDAYFMTLVDLSLILHIQLANPDCTSLDAAVANAVNRYGTDMITSAVTMGMYESEKDNLASVLKVSLATMVTTVAADFSSSGKKQVSDGLDDIVAMYPWHDASTAVPERVNASRRGDSNTLRANPTAVTSWQTADAIIHDLITKKQTLTSAILKTINGKLNSLGTDSRFRTGIVAAGGFDTILYSYIHHSQVDSQVATLGLWLATELEPIVKLKPSQLAKREQLLTCITLANDAYAWLVSIHAFNDGNGRTSKMVGDYVLMKCGIPPIAWGGDYALFGGQLVAKVQDPVKWKEATLVKTVSLVKQGITLWKKAHAI